MTGAVALVGAGRQGWYASQWSDGEEFSAALAATLARAVPAAALEACGEAAGEINADLAGVAINGKSVTFEELMRWHDLHARRGPDEARRAMLTRFTDAELRQVARELRPLTDKWAARYEQLTGEPAADAAADRAKSGPEAISPTP